MPDPMPDPMPEKAITTAKTGRRTKYILLLTIIVGSAIALLSWTQSWYQLELEATTGHPGLVDVSGSVAAPALTALALSGIALAGALSIAGVILRFVFGALEVLLGLCVFASAFFADLDPETAGGSAVTDATGVSGVQSVHDIISSTTTTLWPTVAIIAAVVMVASGVGVLVTAARWPGSSRRYQAAGFEPAAGHAAVSAVGEQGEQDEQGPLPAHAERGSEAAADVQDEPDSVATWDELSRGTDPTD